MIRQAFPRRIKLAAFKRADGRCEKCTARLYTGHFAYDHVTACALGGDNSLKNCEVLCEACHNSKTGGRDIPQIRKADRQQARHLGAKPRKSRPLAGTVASGWRHKMDGSWERR